MVNAHGYSLSWLGEYESPAVLAFRRLGNGLALVLAQRLDGQPGVPQIGLGHGDRRPGQRLGDEGSLSRVSRNSLQILTASFR